MSKLVDEIENRGWAETREDASGKSVSMRVLPWGDYVALTSAVDALMEVVKALEKTTNNDADMRDYDKLSEAYDALPPELKEALK